MISHPQPLSGHAGIGFRLQTFVTLLIVALLPISRAFADCGGNSSTTAPTNAGTLFLFCFEQNIDNLPVTGDGDGYLEMYVSTLADTATITITSNRYPSLNKTVFLLAHSSFSYRISDSTLRESLNITDTMRDLWITSDEVADNRVVMVQSTAPVVCYGLDYKLNSADAFCALPANSAGTDYRVMSYANSVTAAEEPNEPSQFAVAAFSNNTIVTITPSAPTLSGHAAGTPFTITLQRGQAVQVQTDPTIAGLDLTGSIVTANNPIAVFGSHSRTEVPNGWVRPNDGLVSRDMLLESMPPTHAWGSNFVLDAIDLDNVGTISPDGDEVRVLALHPNTIVTMNGQPWVTLNANEFRDAVIKGPMTIQSSGPILVGEYAHSSYTQSTNHDPFLAVVPPVDQSFNSYTFFLPSNTGVFSYQSVIIATDTTSQGSISVDGTLLPAAFFTPVPGSFAGGQGFSILEYPLTAGAHTISTPNPPARGFTILGYGLGDVVSYGYTAGSLLVPKRTIAIQYPPEAMGGRHTNALDFRNTSFEPAYIDSAVFVPNEASIGGMAGRDFGIHVQENVAYDIQRLDVGAGARIHLVSNIPLTEPVSGTVKIYAHTPDYTNLEDAEMPFTLYPDAAAGVGAQDALHLTVTATPNPFSAFTSINFSVPETGDVTMTLYDELGRAVQHITSGEFSAGAYSVRIERRGLADGFYTCVISSQKLNIDERVPIIAGK